jgi:BirA family biotin operon repressor/biotin-[acetyl-CoA-carboxylase] ligase
MSSLKLTHELLNSETIKSLIAPENLSELAEIKIFDLLPSTNSYLLDEAKKNSVSQGTVCLAETQSAGAGRQGRAWFSGEKTNLACSMLWIFPVVQPALSLAVAVMVARALKKYGVAAGIELKWPNDILSAGRKLAGILLESVVRKDGSMAVVIGVGINLQLPADRQELWIDLAEITGQAPARNRMAGLLINELLTGLPVYAQAGFDAFIEAWRQLDCLLGKEITVRTHSETLSGIMEGINETGEMLLVNADWGAQRFQCGEVSVRLKEGQV